MIYQIECEIEGVSPLLQNRFGQAVQTEAMRASRKATGVEDWSLEWVDKVFCEEDGTVYEPASHIEGALIKSAVNFKIKGRRGKTYKDLFKAACWVEPEHIPAWHDGTQISVPEEPTHDPTKPFSLDTRPVIVSRARVMRTRPMLAKGWRLPFTVTITDDQLQAEVVKEVLDHAGRAVGIGDYRPRFGRFIVTKFEVAKE